MGEKWVRENREKVRELSRLRYQRNPDKFRAKRKKCYDANPAKYISKSTAWAKAHRELLNARQRIYFKNRRAEMIEAYGARCECCGEIEPRFLTLEHKNRDGGKHRKLAGGNNSIYVDLKKRGFPKDNYTLYCWNCNCSERYGEKCPHKLKLEKCMSQ